VFDRGKGEALIVIPGVQGRWEWMKPALDELSTRCRAVSYTLCGEIGSDMKFDPDLGFDNFVRQVDRVFDRTGIARAALCGVSYGGLIALRYAALHPERVTSLVFVSAPAPGWVPNGRQQRYLAHPWRSAPAFVLTSPLRLWPEIKAAFDTTGERLRFSVLHGLRVMSAPVIPPRMATRVSMQQELDFAPDCERIKVPTLVVTGEDGLDQVVPAEVTRRYQQLIPGARYVQIKRSGHIGLLTHPAQFANIVTGFINASGH
jgi:3-oxoadipate enol-lactonase